MPAKEKNTFTMPPDLEKMDRASLLKFVKEKMKNGGISVKRKNSTSPPRKSKKAKANSDATKTKTKKKKLTAGESELLKKQREEARELKEQERKEKAEQRAREREARKEMINQPNQLVTFADLLYKKENSARVNMVAWPEVTLQLDHLYLDENDEPSGCKLCVEQYKRWKYWYALHPEKLEIHRDENYVPSENKDGQVEDPRGHEHEIWIEETHLHLPKLTEYVARNKSKKEKDGEENEVTENTSDDESEKSDEGENGSDDDADSIDADDSQTDGKSVEGGRDVKAEQDDLIKVDKPSLDKEEPLGRGRRRTAVKRHYDEIDQGDNDEDDGSESSEKRTKLDLVAADQVSRWDKKWLAYIKTKIYVEKTYGKKTPAKDSDVQAHPFQQFLSDKFKLIDFNKVKPEDNEHIWLGWQAGVGKTLAPVFALRDHPNPPIEALFVTIKSAVKQTLNEIMKVPQLHGRVNWEVLGYDQFRERLSKNPKYAAGKVVIIDEVHGWRNLKKPMIVEMKAVLEQALYRFYLTGTPMQNQLTDAFYIMMLEKIAPLMTMAEILKSKNPAFNIPRTRKQLQQFSNLWKSKGTMFWYEPPKEKAIPTEVIDRPSTMTHAQALWWIIRNTNSPEIGPLLKFGSSTKNSFKVLSKQTENCLMNSDGTVRDSPKFEEISELIHQCMQVPNRKELPLVVYSDCKDRGIYAVREFVLRHAWAKNLRTELMEGKTSSDDRERMRQDFNAGKIDVLFLSPVGKSSLDLLDCAGIIFVEVPQSQGAQDQAAARILRSGAEQKRPGMIVKIYRFISKFPRKPPTPEQLKALWDVLIEYSRFSKEVLIKRWQVDIWPHLIEQLDAVGWETADEHRASYNLEKNEDLQPMIAAMRAATIDLNGHSKMYVDKFKEILNAASAA